MENEFKVSEVKLALDECKIDYTGDITSDNLIEFFKQKNDTKLLKEFLHRLMEMKRNQRIIDRFKNFIKIENGLSALEHIVITPDIVNNSSFIKCKCQYINVGF